MMPITDPGAAQQLLAQGQAALQRGDLPAAAQALGAARGHADTRLAAHNLIEQHRLDGAFGAWTGLDCTISPADDIFHFFAGHPTSINPLRDYFADGWRTLAELMLLMEAAGKPLLGTQHFLEFASGHGRFTRHLVKALGAPRVTVSDVVPDAVAFARQTFGVAGFVSSNDPQALAWPRQWDVVFVLSLFSHLPASRWSPWLAHLYAAVQPGGLLIFTTHGAEALRKQNVQLDESGFRFFASSESHAIDAQEYGTTFTSSQFVRQQIAQHLPGSQLLCHQEACFWSHQDAFVLQKPQPAG